MKLSPGVGVWSACVKGLHTSADFLGVVCLCIVANHGFPWVILKHPVTHTHFLVLPSLSLAAVPGFLAVNLWLLGLNFTTKFLILILICSLPEYILHH